MQVGVESAPSARTDRLISDGGPPLRPSTDGGVLEPDHEPATPAQTAGRVIPADTVCVHPRPVLRATLAPRDPRGSAHKKTLLPTRNLPRSREEATTRRRQYRSNGSKTGTGETGEQAAPYDRPPHKKYWGKRGDRGTGTCVPIKSVGRVGSRVQIDCHSGHPGKWGAGAGPAICLRPHLCVGSLGNQQPGQLCMIPTVWGIWGLSRWTRFELFAWSELVIATSPPVIAHGRAGGISHSARWTFSSFGYALRSKRTAITRSGG